MRYQHTFFYVESLTNAGKEMIVGHSQDIKTGEVYYKFLNRKDAAKLMGRMKEKFLLN